MKTKILLLCACLGAALPVAAAPAGGDGRPDRSFAKEWMHKKHPAFANLTPEEKQKLRAAHEAARDDAAVQAARDKMEAAGKEFRDALRAALLAADPSLEPILDKIGQQHGKRGPGPGQGGPGGKRRVPMIDDPAVDAARENMRGTQTPEAKNAALEELKKAIREARAKKQES